MRVCVCAHALLTDTEKELIELDIAVDHMAIAPLCATACYM